MASKKSLGVKKDNNIEGVRGEAESMKSAIEALKAEVLSLRQEVSALNDTVLKSANRYVASCPSCSTKYDMLAHHYSIGLFDNMVYVKCPKCNKTLPVYGGSHGEVGSTSDESA